MLTIDRKTSQSIIICDHSEVFMKIMGVHNGLVRIGFEAPRSIKIYREELYEKIKRQASGGDLPRYTDKDVIGR